MLIFLLLVAGIGTVGYRFFRHNVAVSRESARDSLTTIANLKVRNIVDWREERLSDSQTVMCDLFLGQQVRKFLNDAPPATAPPGLLARLCSIQKHNQGLRAILIDPQMNVRLASPADKVYFGPIAQTLAKEALRSNRIVMSDLHRNRFTGEIHLDLVIPLNDRLASPGAGSPPLGLIVIAVDPEKFLYPQIQNWPTPSPTGETLLVRREGDEVVYLNELRHQKGTALTLRIPIDKTDTPAVRAVLGHEGVFTGVDYRNKPVLCAVRSIPDTPWFVLAKVDQDEIYATMREQALATGAFTLGFILLAALGLGLIVRRRESRWMRSQLNMELEHRLILDSTDEGILGLDSEGRHVFVNPAACRMLGYRPEELIGKLSHAIWHYKKADGTTYPREECQVLATAQDGIVRHSDREVFWKKDGTSFPVEYNSAPSLEKDRSVAVVLLFRDITERRQAEDALRQSEARTRAITDSAQDAILMMDPRGLISYWNPAAESIFGYRNEEAIGKNLHNLLVPERYLASHHAAFPAFGHTGQGNAVGKTVELEARRKDGREISVALSLSAVSLNGTWHSVGILRDITEQKLVKSQLEQYSAALESNNQALEEFNQIAESATRAKSEFLANMSHEIRTPMTAILGYAELLLDEEGIEKEPPHRREAFETIHRNGKHLLGLINDILDLSKVEAGKMEIEPVRCSPCELLADIVSLMRVRATAKQLGLEMQQVGPLPETILTDPLRLRQVLVNLVGNAIKFTDRGEVRITARLTCGAAVPAARAGETPSPQALLRFDITDTGIEPDIRKTVSKVTAKRLANYIMHEGDVVIGRRGEMGRCALVTNVEDGWLCGTGSFCIKPSDRCDMGYLVRYLRSEGCRKQLEALSGGAVMPNLSNTALGDLLMFLPSPWEQEKIVGEIDTLHEQTQHLTHLYTQKLAALDSLKKSLLHQAFTGEL